VSTPKKLKQQKPWLKRPEMNTPAAREKSPPAAADARIGVPRLLDRHAVCAVVGVTYPTLWTMMRQGKFPRSFIVGGKSKWKSDQVMAWLDALPMRRLRGDAE
jgi:predicted DNA-binding transcriptional regulator AlpA